MRNLLLTIQYLGTNYAGWQVQQNAVSVQEVLQEALWKILNKRVNIYGCSRTDSGVHANMYCCNFHTESNIPCENIVRALNTKLPYDIVAKSCREVPEKFHARYDVVYKEYIYRIWNEKTSNSFEHMRSLYYPYTLNVEKVNKAAQYFLGEHDFTSFQSLGGKKISTKRTVFISEVTHEGEMVIFHVAADGFLYNMVRIMVGTLLAVAQGRIEPEDIKKIINAKDRASAFITAPAHGLYLNEVKYDI